MTPMQRDNSDKARLARCVYLARIYGFFIDYLRHFYKPCRSILLLIPIAARMLPILFI
jgi:hypothetical protein